MSHSKPLVDVSLILKGEELDPMQVTSLLKVKGTKMRKKGQTWRTSTNHEVTAKIGVWTLHANRESMDLHDQIASLKRQLGSVTFEPLQVPGVQFAELDVFIAFGSSAGVDDDYKCQLTPDDLSWILGLKVPVSINISYTPETISQT